MIDLDEIEASLEYIEDWKKVIDELKAARKVVEAARHIHWQCTQQRMENLHMALKELEGGEK